MANHRPAISGYSSITALSFSIAFRPLTTDKAEEGAMLVRQVCPSGELKATSAQLASGKIQAQCKTYNGWNVEKECEIIPVAEVSPTEIKAVLYYRQDAGSPYGIYSNLITLNIA